MLQNYTQQMTTLNKTLPPYKNPSSQSSQNHFPQRTHLQINKSEDQCQKCDYFFQLMQGYKQKLNKFMKKEKSLKKILNKLQQQNNQVIENVDQVMQECQDINKQLQQQIYERDQIINSQNLQIEQLKLQLEQQQQHFTQQNLQHQKKLQQLSQKLEQKNKSDHSKQKYKQHFAAKTIQIEALKSQIMKLISQKSVYLKNNKDIINKLEQENKKLSEEIQSLEKQIASKQKLIKCLSQSNNQIRLQLIELKNKNKASISEITMPTQKKISMDQENESLNKELKKQNEQLKMITQTLQNQIQNLLMQTQQMQLMLVKAKLEKDILKKKIEKARSYTNDPNPFYGKIQHQYNERYSQPNYGGEIRKNKYLTTGFIRGNRTEQASMMTSITNSIMEEKDFQESIQ